MNIRDEIADEIAGLMIEEGYYARTVGITAARKIADAILPLLAQVRAEAVREFLVNDLRDRAEQADARWRAWGDVNDAHLRDRLLREADCIEQDSEGNET